MRIVYAAHDDGVIGVAVDEIDEDFVADTGQKDGSPLRSRPALGDADPTRRYALAPVELHPHAAVFIRAFGYESRLRSCTRLRSAVR